jgi:hypothetical protein
LSLLRRTILNLSQQTFDDFHIILACTEAPVVDYISPEKITIVETGLPIPYGLAERRRDSDMKIAIGGEQAFHLAGGADDFSIMKMDADDLLSVDLLLRTSTMDIEHGFVIKQGYLHKPNSLILWKHFRFHQICGSCVSIVIRRRGKKMVTSPGFYADLFLNSFHRDIPEILKKKDKPLTFLPFWAGVYTLDYGENSSPNKLGFKWRPWRMEFVRPAICKRFPGVSDMVGKTGDAGQ